MNKNKLDRIEERVRGHLEEVKFNIFFSLEELDEGELLTIDPSVFDFLGDVLKKISSAVARVQEGLPEKAEEILDSIEW